MTTLTRLRTVAAAALTLGTTLVLTTAVSGPATAAPHRAEPGPTTFTKNGPFGVGQTTLTLKSGNKVEVWYPAPRKAVKGKPIAKYDLVDWLPPAIAVPDGFKVTYPSGGVRRAPVAKGSFPLVVFSHGFAGFRTQSSFLTSAIASWGFVVAAPEHPSRDITRTLGGSPGTTTDVQDLRATITLMSNQDGKKSSPFFKHINTRRIAAIGHSAGARASEQLTIEDARVDTFIGMAGTISTTVDPVVVPDEPGMLVAAVDDGVWPLTECLTEDPCTTVQSGYDAMATPKRLVKIGGSGHLVFSDICEVGADKGGLTALASAIGIDLTKLGNLYKLATDGCLDPAVAPTDAWPAIEQVVIAYLRSTFNIDDSDAALTGLEDAFPGVVVGNESAE